METGHVEGFEEGRIAFVKEIEGFLSSKDTEHALEAVNLSNNYDMLKSSGFDLIPILGKYVTGQTKKNYYTVYKCAQDILEKLSAELSPQETYLELLEQSEDGDDVKFCTILEIIKSCLLRMPNHRGKSMCWICYTIVRHLCNMDVPRNDDEDVEDKEVALEKRNSEIISNIVMVYECILTFFDPFINKIQRGDCDVPSEHMTEYKRYIVQCLVKCLGRPLVHLNISKDSDHHVMACRILDFISILVADPFTFLKEIDFSFGCVETLEEDAVSCDFTNVSLGCYYYLIFDDDERQQFLSHVFAPSYIFECTMALAYDLMGSNESPLIFKALTLLNYILFRISPKTIEFSSIRDTIMSQFLEMTTRSMVHNEEKEVRQLSVQIFPKFVEKFTPKGQYMIYFNVNQLSPNPGFIGYTMTLVKENVREALDTKNPDCLTYFTGKKLIDLLHRYCKINSLIEADLNSHTDQIMSCLNLIRYLLIRDRYNEANLSVYLTSIDESYIEPVKKACAFARGLYEDYKADINNPPDSRIQVNLMGHQDLLPEMSTAERLEAMNENLTRVDMIDYLASRVAQCLIEYRQNIRSSSTPALC